MCLSCGCRMPNEAHGDERHITMSDLEEAGRASGISVGEVVKNIQETYSEMGGEEARAGAGYQRAYGSEQEGGGPSM